MRSHGQSPQRNIRRSSRVRDLVGAHVLQVQLTEPLTPRRRQHRVARWVLGGVLATTILGALVAGGREFLRRAFYENPEYALSEISVQGDLPMARARILEIAGINLGANIFTLDLRGAYERLDALPEIEAIEIIRRLPNKVAIQLRARHPLAWVVPGTADDAALAAPSWLVDAGGVLFPEGEVRMEHAQLPVIYSAPDSDLVSGSALKSREALGALELINTLAGTRIGARFQVVSIDLSRGYCMTVRDRSRGIFQLGFEDIPGQLENLQSLLAYCDQHLKEIQHANLMIRRNVPVMFAGEEPRAGGTEYEPVALPAPPPTPAPAQEIERPAPRPPRSATPPPVARASAARKPSPAPARPSGRGAYNVPLTPWVDAARQPVRR